jgi:hypothetical protein
LNLIAIQIERNRNSETNPMDHSIALPSHSNHNSNNSNDNTHNHSNNHSNNNSNNNNSHNTTTNWLARNGFFVQSNNIINSLHHANPLLSAPNGLSNGFTSDPLPDSMPVREIDTSSIQTLMSHNRQQLQVKLLVRRPIAALIDQGILPRTYRFHIQDLHFRHSFTISLSLSLVTFDL